MEIGETVYIDKCDIIFSVDDSKYYDCENYPYYHTWYIIRDKVRKPEIDPENDVYVLQKHPFSIKISYLINNTNHYIYMDCNGKMYWKMDNDNNFVNYVTFKKKGETLDVRNPTLEDYNLYIDAYYCDLTKKFITYADAEKLDLNSWKNSREKLNLWKDYLYNDKLDLFNEIMINDITKLK